MRDERADRLGPDDMVVTPGGRRPAGGVRRVGPGETVDLDVVPTPGGYRPRSRVHHVQRGNRLDVRDGHCRQLDPSGAVVADHGAVSLPPRRDPRAPGAEHTPPPSPAAQAPPEAASALGSGWIVYASWHSPSPITLFSTAWEVPPEPLTRSGQLVYLFNAMEYEWSPDSWPILQPVLQWGASPAGGGDYWAVASWMVFGSDFAFHSDVVRVDVGDRLVGLMTMTGERSESDQFDYRCEFPNIADTTLNIVNSGVAFDWAFETLEAYRITQCSDYPADPKTEFWAVRLENPFVVKPGDSGLTWTPVKQVTDCGQNVFVHSDTGSCGQVDVYYRPWRRPDWGRSVASAQIR